MSGSFPKALRLRRRGEFLRTAREGRRLFGRILAIDCRRSASGSGTRLGITASRKYGDAPERNRFKRLVREAFRTAYSSLPQGWDLNVYPRNEAKKASYEALRAELISLTASPETAQRPQRSATRV